MRTVRFEDFEYEYMEELGGNILSWLGNGLTVAQERDDFTTGYLDTVDLPPIPVKGVGMIKVETEELEAVTEPGIAI